jgi:hypothetical protein
MHIRRSAKALGSVALLALMAFGGALYEESFVHTDDGCVVEVHCVACRLLLGGATIFPTVPILVPGVVAVAPPNAPEPVARPTVTPRLFQSRAPPLA